MISPQLRLIYDTDEGHGPTYVNVARIRQDVPFPEAVKAALDEVTVGLLRNLAFDLIPMDDAYEKKLHDKLEEIGKVIR